MHKRIIADRGLVDDAEEEGQKGLPCDICKTSFPTPIRLAEHRRTQKHKDMATKMGVEEEEEVAGFPCDICGGKLYSNISNLRRH
jgi:hypothetical protein